jgi:hypothetical protein
MTDASNPPTPLAGLPDSLAAELAEFTPAELRNTIIHARKRHQFHEERESPVEPGPGDDILRATDKGATPKS